MRILFDFTNDGIRNDFEAQGMCSASPFPSPLKKQTTVKKEAYGLLKRWFDELVSILDDSAADQRLSHFTGKVFRRSHSGENGSCCPFAQAYGSNCVQRDIEEPNR